MVVICPICGPDHRWCSILLHLKHEARLDEKAKIVAFLRAGRLNGPAETVYADAIERGDYEKP